MIDKYMLSLWILLYLFFTLSVSHVERAMQIYNHTMTRLYYEIIFFSLFKPQFYIQFRV